MERACMCTPQITLKIWAGLHAACYIIHTCTHIYKGCLADDEAGCCLLRADGQLLLYVAAAPVVDAVHYGLMAMAKEPLFCRAAAPACCCWGCSKGFFRTCSAVGRERGSCDIRRCRECVCVCVCVRARGRAFAGPLMTYNTHRWSQALHEICAEAAVRSGVGATRTRL
eukprot:1159488-Pelagomonas_calceolata.AAC.11